MKEQAWGSKPKVGKYSRELYTASRTSANKKKTLPHHQLTGSPAAAATGMLGQGRPRPAPSCSHKHPLAYQLRSLSKAARWYGLLINRLQKSLPKHFCSLSPAGSRIPGQSCHKTRGHGTTESFFKKHSTEATSLDHLWRRFFFPTCNTLLTTELSMTPVLLEWVKLL